MTPYYSDSWLTVYQGDCREAMASMDHESVHCVVTSPPYWGLRDYGTATWIGGIESCPHRIPATGSTMNKGNNNREGKPFDIVCGKCGAIRQDSQLGLEPTPEEYVANMVAVFREVRRVLRADGTVWLNLGDSYAGSWSGHSMRPEGGEQRDGGPGFQPLDARYPTRPPNVPGLKPKDLVGIPWRVAFALQADGWYLRSDIIWSKPNPMPESVTDRPTKAHEYLFLLSKSARYYYDADAVREPSDGSWNSAAGFSGNGKRAGGTGYDLAALNQFNGTGTHEDRDQSGRNLRSVWTIATQPYPGAHFATFPEKLIEPCIKAGTSDRGVCPECGAPWTPIIARTVGMDWNARKRGNDRLIKGNGTGADMDMDMDMDRIANPPRKTGWQRSCDHGPTLTMGDASLGAVVLDPFAGSGTTGRVAQRLGRRAVLIDLNGDYLTQAMTRNQDIPLGLETA